MRVVLLGTGAADGWPNPFCRCAACTWARSTGSIRTTTSALVDDVILLDCGPDAPRQADRAGIGLAGLRAVLVTHAHPDHLAPEALLARSWARATEPLRVIGPTSVIAACEHWIGPHDPVGLEEVRPGDVLDVDGYTVRVLAAAHDVGRDDLARDAVLYDVTSPDGTRLLYATDTAALPEATADSIAGAAYDLVLLEQTFGDVTDHGTGHLDLDTFPRELARLRTIGAVTPSTDVVAIHLGHHNPVDLADRMAPWAVRVLDDLSVIDSGTTTPRRETPRRTLLLGGARSGKSRTAEQRLAAHSDVRYVATGGTRDADAEWAARVTQHRSRRPATWTTIETLDLEAVLADAAPTPVLVDCLALWLAGRLDTARVWDTQPGTPARAEALHVVARDVDRLVESLRATPAEVVLVSNEVGSGVVPEHESGRLYRDLLGTLNARIASACDEVVLVVAGRSVPLTPTGAHTS